MGCLGVWVNLQLEEVNAHSLEGPGEGGVQGLRGSKPRRARGHIPGIHGAHAPSQVALSLRKDESLLLANDQLRHGHVDVGKKRQGKLAGERGLGVWKRLPLLIKNIPFEETVHFPPETSPRLYGMPGQGQPMGQGQPVVELLC